MGDGPVQIRRTADGIPHILADDWQGLGRGFAYAQAQDAACTLAEAFLTFEGSRARHFGEDAQPAEPSSFGRPKNVELDIFFRHFLSAEKIARFRKAQPAELLDVADGFAQGYNEYIAAARKDARLVARHPCLGQAWTRNITQDDIIRRMLAVGIAAGYAKFIPEITGATPPPSAVAATGAASLAQRASSPLGENASLGSNMMAFGGATTGSASAVLMGNPHWYWSGPDRFYQVHLTIPGKLNVAGVAFFGIPVVMIGFNDAVAWSHTVSAARRFGLFELELVPGHPDRYRYDGVERAIEPVTIELAARSPDGGSKMIRRTLYRSHLGPMIDLRAQSEELAWSTSRAIAIRDINEDNDRVFATYLAWNQARSLTEFAEIHRSESSIPWAHTLAVGRADGRVWYADIGPVPHVPDELRQRCTSALGKAFAQFDPTVPFLDGSKASCGWLSDARARLPGMMPWEMQPFEWRTDYAANMNGSYWPTSATDSVQGFPLTMGGERESLSMRTRLGHRIARELTELRPLDAGALAQRLRDKVLDSRAYSAALYKQAALTHLCPLGAVDVSVDTLTSKTYSPPRTVDFGAACKVLSAWKGSGNIDDGGALLWDAFWNRVSDIPEQERYATPFSADDPLNTPNTLNVADPRIALALGSAILALQESGIGIADTLGKHLYAGSDTAPVPLFGGCETSGYFTIACDDDGAYNVNSKQFVGNAYLQVVRFENDKPQAYTLLAHGQGDLDHAGKPDPAVVRYARKDWLYFPFSEGQILRDAKLAVTRLPALPTRHGAVKSSRKAIEDGSAGTAPTRAGHTQ
ncbi:penicillin acylase family protein [Massilia scottii]|uniref:penicillin acylase family protein n=1 Tax=Massilia scottii TaxID=3057166 RepID=UPI002796AF64|nr:penicillin acylase family protein [Massilia sp. CCM 9029]MDQ1835475.1 penicillin acylase family protein [Massilia sp. CCM 9029]